MYFRLMYHWPSTFRETALTIGNLLNPNLCDVSWEPLAG